MKYKLTITEEEKKRILGLYEQETPETEPKKEEEEGSLIKFLTDNKFEENQNYIGSYEIKTDDKSFGVVLSLTPDKSTIKTATIVGPNDIISQMEEVFKNKNIPVVKTEGKLITRIPFNDQEIIQGIVSKVKELNGEI